MNKDLQRLKMRDKARVMVKEALRNSINLDHEDSPMILELAISQVDERYTQVPFKWFKPDAPRIDWRRAKRYNHLATEK